MKLTSKDWPILFISKEFDSQNDDGFRLRELIDELESTQECSVILSFSYEDALEVFSSRADIGGVMIDWDLPEEDKSEKMQPNQLVKAIRKRNAKLPIILLTDHLETEKLPNDILGLIDDCIWKTADTVEFLSGRVKMLIDAYLDKILPVFFKELMEYSERYKYAWHTPGHLGGQGFLRSPAGVAMYKFFGENTFRSDLSISVPELGSLLDHEGVCGDAERNSAKVFGADQTYYVLNGTSTVNQIIWRSQVSENDVAFVDRNCHKSLNYAMVITNAIPIYMIPRRNGRGIIGPVRLNEFSNDFISSRISSSKLVPENLKKSRVRMSALTNSTYDGVCYNVTTIKASLGQLVDNMHFDEAWYAYAKFNPMYKDHYGMAPEKANSSYPPIFCSQSTHKLLTAFSQASMLHIKDGSSVKIDPAQFNESYMMHGSTSPQYNMIASLDVATKMMDDNGHTIIGDIIREAIQLRVKVAALEKSCHEKGDWFFGMWQPDVVDVDGKLTPFAETPIDYLATHQKPWVMDKKQAWHGFADIEDNYIMLDPIKLTITTPGIDNSGVMAKGGIPASIVTNYLIRHNIVCEKTDYYSFLMLNSLGTTRAKQGALLAALFKFKELYDSNALLEEAAPDLVAKYPEQYGKVTLKEHCNAIHTYFREHKLLAKMQAAFEVIPDQAMTPGSAFKKVVRGEFEHVRLDDMMNRTAAVMLVPYPPGIPIMMGGEVMNAKAKPIFDYLKAREEFEENFPGYEGDIHGIEREVVDGKAYFKTMVLK